MCQLYRFFIKCFSAGFNPHVLNGFISKLLYMETVCNL